MSSDFARALCACVFAGFMSACAFGDETLQLPRSSSLTSGVFGGQERRVVVIVPFQDDRSIQTRCGMKKNSYNMDTANLLCSDPPARWLATLLAEELRKAGFDAVSEPPSPDAGAGLRIDGSLVRLFMEPMLGFVTVSGDTEMQVQLRASTKSGLLATRSFFVRTSRSSIAGTMDVYQESFDEATQKIVRDMVAAILQLMNRYPDVSLELSVGTEVDG